MNDHIAPLRNANTPNLYTTLIVGKNSPIKITASTIIFLVEKIINEFITSQMDNVQLQGNGQKDTPYFLNNPLAWLLAAKYFSIEETSLGKKYFDLIEWLADVSVKDRYASTSSCISRNPDEFTSFVSGCVQQISSNLSHDINNSPISELAINLSGKSPTSAQTTAFIPLALTLIQTLDAAYIGGKVWAEPPYSAIAKKHMESQSFIALNKHKLTTESINEASKKLSEPLDDQSSNILISSIPSLISNAVETIFDQFLSHSNIANEKKILLENTKMILSKNIANIDVAGMKSPSPWDLACSMIPAIAASLAVPEVEQVENVINLNFLPENIIATAKDMCEKVMDGQFDCNQKYNTLDDISCIMEIRQILQGNICKPHSYLPILTIALFFAEVSRYPSSFISGLMLMDLIQMQAKTPDTNAPYTILNLMSNPENRHLFVDAYGTHYGVNKGCKNAACFECVEFIANRDPLEQERESLKSALNECKKDALREMLIDSEQDQKKGEELVRGKKHEQLVATLLNKLAPKTSEFNINVHIAGYHPMVHGGSYHETKNPTKYTKLEIAHQKSASIILQWLAIQLENDGYTVKLERCVLNEGHFKMKIIKELENMLKSYLLNRIKTFSFQEKSVENYDDRREYYNVLSSSTLFKQLNEEYLIENRSKTIDLRRAYDNRFGLVNFI